MKLVAQRVVRPSDQATGVNAYCYLHEGQDWLDEPPPDLGRGKLVSRLLEVEPPVGNRVRSYVDITTPDHTSDEAIVSAVLSGAELLFDSGETLPFRLHHAGTSFTFNLELSLARQWQVELRLLVGYALRARRQVGGIFTAGGIFSGAR